MHADAIIVAVYAGIVAAVILLRALLHLARVPAIIGFLALGVGLHLLAGDGGLDHVRLAEPLHLLGKVGVAVLLFRIGLESNPRELFAHLGSASWLWFGNVAASLIAGFVAARFLLGFEMVPSVVITTALVATSVGIPSAVWRDADKLRTDNGERFLDVAELDDVTGILLMALLFAVLPELRAGGDGHVFLTAGRQAGILLLKLLGFGAVCFLYSQFAERHVTRWLTKLTSTSDMLIGVVATALLIAGLAGMLGLSLAVGAFFAGLAYSRDPESVKMDRSLSPIYELFVPFFFLSVGFSLYVGSLGAALVPLGVLTVAAVVGKVVGTGLPALAFTGLSGAMLLGVSMVPRAEICLLIAQRTRNLGPDVLPRNGYTALVLTSAVTILIVPIALRIMLQRLGAGEESSGSSAQSG